MKTFDEFLRKAAADYLRSAAGTNDEYATALLNLYEDEYHDRIAYWALKAFARQIFEEAGRAQWDAAAEDVAEEDPELRGQEFAKAVKARVDAIEHK